MPYITYSVRIPVGILLFVVSVVRHLRTSNGCDARLVLHALLFVLFVCLFLFHYDAINSLEYKCVINIFKIPRGTHCLYLE